jgi:DNA helicase II / ATP-dependent DNA helicase PcrA
MNLAIYIANYAKGAYEDFDGEPDLLVDAAGLTTIHKAKGLEWAAVFVPSLTTSRFPSSRTGRPRDWQSRGSCSARNATRAPTPTNGGCSTWR